MANRGSAGDGARGTDAPLTPRSLFRLDYLAPPPDLQPYITVIYLFRCDEADIRDIQAASIGHLTVFLAGKGTMHFPDGREVPTHPVSLLTPFSKAVPFEVAGPFHALGAVIAPLGWGALTGCDASEWADRVLDAEDMFGPDAATLWHDLSRIYAADPEGSGPALVAPLAEFIRNRLRPVPRRHRELVQATVDWLATAFDPPVSELYARSRYSPRQTQRLVARYFGSTPIHLVRKYRATRVVALLNQPDLDDATVAMLTNQFYDQPHMIREIREFIGRTPARFGDGDAPILEAVVNMRNFTAITPRVAPMPHLAKQGDQD